MCCCTFLFLPLFLLDENAPAQPFLLLMAGVWGPFQVHYIKDACWVLVRAERVSQSPGSLGSSFLDPTLLSGPQWEKEKIKHSFRHICLRGLFLKAPPAKDITEFDLSPWNDKSEWTDFWLLVMARFSFFKFMDHLGRLWIELCSNIYHHQWPLSLYQSDRDSKRQFPFFCPQSEAVLSSKLSRRSPSLLQWISFTEIFKSKGESGGILSSNGAWRLSWLSISFFSHPGFASSKWPPSPHFVVFQIHWIAGIFKKCREELHDIDLGSDFMGMTPKAQATKAKIDVWLHQNQQLLNSKRNHQWEKKPHTEWENTLVNHLSDKWLISKAHI